MERTYHFRIYHNTNSMGTIIAHTTYEAVERYASKFPELERKLFKAKKIS